MMPSRFITFEGLDGSGKSTHLRRAARWLELSGVAFEQTRNPGGTHLGQAIRGLVLDPATGPLDGVVEALLMFADRRHHLEHVVEPALAAGRHVLCDRFTDSTLAYQGAGRGVPPATLDAIDQAATGRRRPDHTLLFDLPAVEARRRGQSESRRVTEGVDRIDAEDLAFYERVRQAFLAMARHEAERFTVIDAAGSVDDTWSQVERALVAQLLERS
ncbi:MAG: dTMP kinase [Acidobacteria bacterium]|nr:dTMP kinase [Acidobacteriota bacterium]